MEERIEPYQVTRAAPRPGRPCGADRRGHRRDRDRPGRARHPLIVTSYLGRDPAAVPSLVALASC